MKELTKKDDFHRYKKELDLARKYEHEHRGGEPLRYPCRVYSEFFDDPNGPYTYNHTFVYQQNHDCEKCGHNTMIWPEVVRD